MALFFVIWRYLFACDGLTVKILKMTPKNAGVNLGQASILVDSEKDLVFWTLFFLW